MIARALRFPSAGTDRPPAYRGRVLPAGPRSAAVDRLGRGVSCSAAAARPASVGSAAVTPTRAGADRMVVVRTVAGRAAIRRRHRKVARLRPPAGVLPSGASPVATVTADRLASVADRPLPWAGGPGWPRRWSVAAAVAPPGGHAAAGTGHSGRAGPGGARRHPVVASAHRGPPDADPRAVVEQIRALNGLADGDVLPVGRSCRYRWRRNEPRRRIGRRHAVGRLRDSRKLAYRRPLHIVVTTM